MPAALARSADDILAQEGPQIGALTAKATKPVSIANIIDKVENEILPVYSSGGSLMGGVTPRIEAYIGDLKKIQEAMGDEVPAPFVHELRQHLSQVINFGKRDTSGPAQQANDAFKSIRRVVSGELGQLIDTFMSRLEQWGFSGGCSGVPFEKGSETSR